MQSGQFNIRIYDYDTGTTESVERPGGNNDEMTEPMDETVCEKPLFDLSSADY